MTTADTIRHDLGKINNVVAAARQMIADGQVINLTPLEKEVERICAGMLALRGADARGLEPVLVSLIDDLDKLAAEMRTRQDEIEGDLRSMSTRGRAVNAYAARARKAPARTR